MAKSSRPRNFSFTGLFRLTRFPNLLIIALTQYMTALFLTTSTHGLWAIFTHPGLFWLTSSTLMLAAAGYIINDYYDVKIDYINKPERVIVGRILKRRIAMIWQLGLNLAGILIGFFLSPWIGLIHCFSAFTLWLYSNQLKRLPFVGNFSIALLTGVSVLVVAVLFGEKNWLIFTYAYFAFGITLVREIIKDMEDLKGDETFGCKTLPIVWGIRKTKQFVFLLLIVFVASIFYFVFKAENEVLNTYFMVMIIPAALFILYFLRADTKDKFANLSTFCKLFILSGIISMAFFAAN
ncbi:geranylgeranylglycerol-phosphate geranylgeranyltransferase [Imperialibacter roseus]|uniref:Geranylgeranylglycerol-phosphate geranylgeranyltransferase n=1 Tax=Imperialibacter roseus TaxID=1324217 RepID=A0ABZ0IMJ5_9BACT|nr:geranylgeranylglycerol-phosphate geranylgeranyltransferase [Imperialibacter roseus]WOK06253.1 geranylgeranylglycerol-phosphate geranylgeranyltransferase [Imperialibacter roseus]